MTAACSVCNRRMSTGSAYFLTVYIFDSVRYLHLIVSHYTFPEVEKVSVLPYMISADESAYEAPYLP
jgi:hypothetical protein